MVLEWKDIAIVGLTAASGVIGWVLRELWDAIKKLNADLADLQKTLPEMYARRDDVKAMFEQLLNAVERLGEKIDRKADK